MKSIAAVKKMAKSVLFTKLKYYAEIIAVVGVILGGIGASIAFLGDSRPLMAYEARPLFNDLLLRLQKELIEYKAKRTEYQNKGQQVPDWVTEKIILLERDINKLKD